MAAAVIWPRDGPKLKFLSFKPLVQAVGPTDTQQTREARAIAIILSVRPAAGEGLESEWGVGRISGEIVMRISSTALTSAGAGRGASASGFNNRDGVRLNRSGPEENSAMNESYCGRYTGNVPDSNDLKDSHCEFPC
jgi:hypothetical protein